MIWKLWCYWVLQKDVTFVQFRCKNVSGTASSIETPLSLVFSPGIIFQPCSTELLNSFSVPTVFLCKRKRRRCFVLSRFTTRQIKLNLPKLCNSRSCNCVLVQRIIQEDAYVAFAEREKYFHVSAKSFKTNISAFGVIQGIVCEIIQV